MEDGKSKDDKKGAINNSTQERILSATHGAFKKAKDFSKNGNAITSTVSFVSSCAVFVLSILSLINPLNALTPLYLLLNIYIGVMSLVAIAYDFPFKQNRVTIAVRNFIVRWFRAFDRLTGRGALYIFIGTLAATSSWSSNWTVRMILGLSMIVAGVMCIACGMYISSTLQSVRDKISGMIDGDIEKLRSVFGKYDVDGNGTIDSVEFSKLCVALGHPMDERATLHALNLLDSDHNGTVEFDEFAAWWQAKKEYV
eukprot:GFYU01015552.1.p1 GENE.GFYU01015552.1~~GFYU01015552.1.p1  ORF type:complete len:271 (+),score=71.12 GFYU01015552.1:50-814(+)